VVAAGLVERFDRCALVPGDDFFGFVRQGAVDPWLPEARHQNTAVIEAAAGAAGRLAGYCDVVYEGVVGPWFLAAFLERSGLGRLHYAVLLPPLQTCLDRVRTRIGHGFTDPAATEHMWRDFDRAAIEGRYLFQDPAAQPAELARQIADRMASRTIRYPEP
jgi:hypothetical protein